MPIDEKQFVQNLNELMRVCIDAERNRCIAICEGWMERFEGTEIQYTSSREYACDAINDIMDLIRDGVDPFPAVGTVGDGS